MVGRDRCDDSAVRGCVSTRPWIVDDDLWALIEPLLPPWPTRSPGPRPVADRLCLQGILYVLCNDIARQLLPPELGFGSGLAWTAPTSARKRGSRHRSVAGRPAADRHRGPSPVDRRKTGSRHHLICDGRGTPLNVITTAANVNDVTQTLALVDGIPPVAGRPGRPRRRPEAPLGEKGYDSNPNRDELRKRRILPVISRKGAPNIKDMGKLRYVVEQTFALLHQFKRLAARWERRTELHDALVSLACSLICWRRLNKPEP
ncbi:transposase [Streptomyces lavendulae]|uniref:transposase n=1 Tax=Streptomyces lavendulae TaxID=1914 RepID=UPI00371D4551